MSTQFSKRIRHLRNQTGLTQEQAAKAIGVSRPTLARWELATSQPSRSDGRRAIATLHSLLPVVLTEQQKGLIRTVDAMDREERRLLLFKVVGERFGAIYWKLEKRSGNYIYGAWRTTPEQLGWRYLQTIGLRDGLQAKIETSHITNVMLGRCDWLIEEVWHDAAAAEYFYRWEKDWGRPDD